MSIQLGSVDHEGTESIEGLECVRHAVAGQVHAHPGNPQLRELVQAVEVGIGVERIIGRTAAFEVGEVDVDRRPISARRIAPAPKILDAVGELLH